MTKTCLAEESAVLTLRAVFELLQETKYGDNNDRY